MARKTHKDRVNELNAKLESLSEHHDIPKVCTISWRSVQSLTALVRLVQVNIYKIRVQHRVRLKDCGFVRACGAEFLWRRLSSYHHHVLVDCLKFMYFTREVPGVPLLPHIC